MYQLYRTNIFTNTRLTAEKITAPTLRKTFKPNLYFKGLATLVILLFSTTSSALTVNAVVTIYDDPNNYLGLNGLVGIGDSVTANTNLTGTPNQFYDTGTIAGYSYPGTVTFTIEGLANPTPGSGNSFSVRIFNDSTQGFGPGSSPSPTPEDFYTISSFFASPEAGYESLIWGIGALDETGTAFNSTDFFDLTDISAFSSVGVTAYLWDADTQTAEFLLFAEVQQVPLPAAAYLFISGIAGLIGLRKLRS